MITISQLTEILGWASVVNIAFLILATFSLIFMKRTISAIHSKLFGIDKQELNSKYFDILSLYEILTLLFFISPYIALSAIGY